jgi:hypothetical protein
MSRDDDREWKKGLAELQERYDELARAGLSGQDAVDAALNELSDKDDVDTKPGRPDHLTYSYRSATIGSMRVARNAGR